MTRLSYVVVADGWAPIAELAEALGRQTAASEVELVLVSEHAVEPPACDVAVRTVVAPERASRVEGVRAASGDVVALGETHVVPSPDWARAVLDAHDAGAVAVLPRMRNANPRTALSWAAFLLDYGRYAGAAPATTRVPTYNASVLRAALLALPDLERALVPGLALDEALRAQGARVAQLSGAATLSHVNVDRPVDWVRERVLGGFLLGRRRGATFGPGRRVAYALAAPLIAAVLFARARRAPRDGAPRTTLVALALASLVTALAEAAGYVVPAPHDRAARRMLEYETHKRAFVRGGP